jgi:DnaJ-class molecular chaperone
MPFRIEGVDPKTGKEIIKKIPSPAVQEDQHSCGLCSDSGTVEEGQFCSCAKGQEMRRAELHLPKPKISTPPAPDNQDRSVFDQKGDLGRQLDLFSDDQTG